jgi:hypothetical protein
MWQLTNLHSYIRLLSWSDPATDCGKEDSPNSLTWRFHRENELEKAFGITTCKEMKAVGLWRSQNATTAIPRVHLG